MSSLLRKEAKHLLDQEDLDLDQLDKFFKYLYKSKDTSPILKKLVDPKYTGDKCIKPRTMSSEKDNIPWWSWRKPQDLLTNTKLESNNDRADI